MQISTSEIITDPDQLRRVMRGWRADGETVALAPIKSGLHDGHLSLVETASKLASRVVVASFGGIDPGRAMMLDRTPCDLIFAPTALSETTLITVHAPRLGDRSELGAMPTNMVRVFNQVQPDVAVFGEKDWQQLVTMRRIARDLDIPVRIVSTATMREDDGLAISSRNSLLSAEQRAVAPTLNKVLNATAGMMALGQPVETVVAATHRFLSESGFRKVEYVAARRAHDLAPITSFDAATPARLFAAVQLGGVRLTDNVPIASTAT